MNNNESFLKEDNESNKEVVSEDFNFLKKLEFPTMNVQPSITTETSYQSSIFSIQSNQSNNTNNELDSTLLDDFYSKEMNLQINSEITTTIPYQQQFTNTDIQSTKQFPKYYTSNEKPKLIEKKISKINKPSLPSSSTIHICPFCQRQFKNKPYLARHLKKHDTVKDFKCPFFNEKESKCHHLNGEFSRKDTFKAHLKSIHFIYPVGVLKQDRGTSKGRCAGCYEEFQSNNQWLNDHIETNECSGLVSNKSKDL